jgi:serine/threonine protein kinase/S1-C subfamily serine protease
MSSIQCPLCGKKIEINTTMKEVTCPECQKSFNPAKVQTVNYESDKIPTVTAPVPTDDEPILPSGTKLGQYEIKEMIGRGGMGTVYKAYQSVLDRFVAIKVLPTKLSSDPEFHKRFNREAKAIASLSHHNIISIYDMGQDGNYFYFVMEFVEGITIRDMIETKKLPPEEALKIVPQLCDALEYAHTEGVVHRDIKPENILIDKKGRIKIADFGLARLVKGEFTIDSVTKTHEIMGTFDYMAPEQRVNSKDVDHRVDIYSLGVVFYEMLTGELPIGRFELPSHKVQIDVRIDDVVLKTLEKEPSKRYQRAMEVGTAVTQIISGQTQTSTPTTSRRNTIINVVCALILSLIPTFVSQVAALIWGLFIRAETGKDKPRPDAFYLSTAAIVISIFWLIAGFFLHIFTFGTILGGCFLIVIVILLCKIIVELIPIGQPTRCSLLALFSLIIAFIPLVITQIIGIILGFIALRRIKNSAGMLKGRGLAIAGIVASIVVLIIVIIIAIPIAIIAVPNALTPGFKQTLIVTPLGHPYMGVNVCSVNEALTRFNIQKTESFISFLQKYPNMGVFILSIEPKSPAENAGLRKGDIILEYNNQKLHSPKELRNLVGKSKVDEKVAFKIYRDGEEKLLYVTVANRSIDMIIEETVPFLGVSVRPIDKSLAFEYGYDSIGELFKELKIDKAEGLFVAEVTPDSSANKVGILEGDIILEYNYKKVNSVNQLRDFISESGVDKKVTLKIIRDGERKSIQVTIGEKKDLREKDLTKQKYIELFQTLEVANSIKDEHAKTKTIYEISIRYAEIGEFDKAIEITKPITDNWKSQALIQITRIYVQSGQKSSEILNQALEVAKTILEVEHKSHTIYEISIRYAEIGEYDKAIETIKLIESDQWKSQALQEISRVRARNK